MGIELLGQLKKHYDMLIMYSDRDIGGPVIEKTSTMTIVISLKGDRSALKADTLVS